MEKFVLDIGLGATALSSPYWLQLLNTGLGLAMLIGGIMLLSLRLIISWREYKRGKDNG